MDKRIPFTSFDIKLIYIMFEGIVKIQLDIKIIKVSKNWNIES